MSVELNSGTDTFEAAKKAGRLPYKIKDISQATHGRKE